MRGHALVLSTAPSAAEGHRIARELVSSGLAACVNVLPPGGSFYVWEGRMHQARESLLVMKTTASGVSALQRALLLTHPYDVPEFLVVRVASGHRAYLDWIDASVRAVRKRSTGPRARRRRPRSPR